MGAELEGAANEWKNILSGILTVRIGSTNVRAKAVSQM